MKITRDHETRAIALITHDVEATLGTRHKDDIREQASLRRTIDAAGPDEYCVSVAEEVQQVFHDCYIDITWPRCPFHDRHPLWMHDGCWTCEELGARVAKLGELRATRDSAGRYVIQG